MDYDFTDFRIGDEPQETEGFNVSVRTFDSMLKLKKQSAYRRTGDFMLTISSAVLLWAAFMLILSMCDAQDLTVFVLPGVLLFIAATFAGSRLKERGKILLFAVIAAALVAVLIVFRKYIWGGYALLSNQLFDVAETAQSYVYYRMNIGEMGSESADLCMYITAVWISCLAGFLASLPGIRYRRAGNAAVVIILAFIFAYFGMEPSVLYSCILAAALFVSAGTGRISSALPLILLVGVLTAALLVVDPGKADPVSKANEYLRDRFALRGAYLEGVDQKPDDISETERQGNKQPGLIDMLTGKDNGRRARIVRSVFAVLSAALIAAAIYYIHRRLARKRKRIREGIDSDDPKIAVGAMFPYAVRWLSAGGIDTEHRAFSELLPDIAENIGDDYSERYKDMLSVWKEAVYSDHSVSENMRQEMSFFLKDTVKMIKKNSGLTDKLKIYFRYAL